MAMTLSIIRRRRPNTDRPRLILLLVLMSLILPVSASYAGESAVVLMYHRFGDSRYPTTSIQLAQFEAHIAELKSGPYTVLPVPEILRRLRVGEDLPDRTVGITIDDAYTSVYKEAWPRLRDA
nr:hypothetical protein [Alphaproteobacteria bacterium]